MRGTGAKRDVMKEAIGFFFWTGVDNYEWLHGYDVAFGLFDRDRTPRPSAALAARWAHP